MEGFITAGGLSSRMGRDKAWLEIGGRPMIEHVIAALMPVTSSVSVIANSPEYSRLGLRVFADTHTGVGPLEAIRTSLVNAQAPRAALVGCDLPFVTSELFSFLFEMEGDHQAIVPIGEDERLEPLCAVYSVAALDCVADLIKRGERKVSKLFDLVPTRLIAFDELRHLRGAELFFQNVNTLKDYARACKVIHQQGMV
ncbi:MAG TPA: molybdenum cofactor guanylyltransferase [Blastocatellia bacterium]|nr:molybdenum cofactor guanylyltransferase [Blastocatellia bacterium]